MDALQQFGRRFVGGVLGDQFAGEGAGEDCRAIARRRRKGRRELVHLPRALANRNSSWSAQRKLSPHGLLDDGAQSGGGLMIEHSESFRNKTGIGLEHGGFR